MSDTHNADLEHKERGYVPPHDHRIEIYKTSVFLKESVQYVQCYCCLAELNIMNTPCACVGTVGYTFLRIHRM